MGAALAGRGIAALRYDKRGVAASLAAGPKEQDLRFDAYVADAAAWVELLRRDKRFSRVGLIGHSEGSLIGMLAARRANTDVFVSITGCGRPAPAVLREQLAKHLASEAVLKEKSDKILGELIAGRTVADVPRELHTPYRPSVQPYLISYFAYDPAREIAALTMPVLIVQGTSDIQVPVSEARLLARAKKDAQLCVIEGMNHVMKHATSDADQQATYTDPSRPLVPEVVEKVSAYILGKANAK
jgi:alpha-beta hydrolase superfamily lysophospholipase